MDKETMKSLAETAKALSEPLDIEKLINDGVIIQKGKSYYIKDMAAMLEHVSKKIKSITPTRNGAKVIFYKETKSIKKIANDLSGFLE